MNVDEKELRDRMMLACLPRQLVMRVAHLQAVSSSCFALQISHRRWLRVGQNAGYRYHTQQRRKRDYILWKSDQGLRSGKFAARSDQKQRAEDLATFMGDRSAWPSDGVLLESARLFGPPSLRPSEESRSRLAALFDILWTLETGTDKDEADSLSGAGQDVDDEDENEEDTQTEAGSEGCESEESESSCEKGEALRMFPPPFKVEMSVWPPPLSPEEVVQQAFAQLEAQQWQSSLEAVRGRRILQLTPPYKMLQHMLQKVKHGVSDDDGCAPEDARVLLTAAGLEEGMAWVGVEPFSKDLLIAMLTAKWRWTMSGRLGRGPFVDWF